MLLGQCGNFFTQALYFVLLARLLAVREYGVFAAAFALVTIVTPYSALGSNMLFMRYVTADRSVARTYWGNMMAVTTMSSLLITGLMLLIGPMLTHVRRPAVFVLLVIANCFFMQIVTGASSVFATFEKMKWSAALGTLSNLLRLAAVGVMRIALHHATVTQWCVGLLIATAVAAIVAFACVIREIGRGKVDVGLIRKRLGEGVSFAFAGTTQSVYNDVDKTMLGHYGLVVQNGFYTLAYRVVDFATAPIAALDSAVLPRYFRLSHNSFGSVVKLAIKSAGIALGTGLAISLCTLLAAPLVPHLVGHGFSGAVVALHWLAWLPPIRAIHRLVGGVLTSTGNQKLRTISQFIVAAFNVALNVWWIPAYGWIGAAWSSVATDGLLAVLTVALVAWLYSSPQLESQYEPG